VIVGFVVADDSGRRACERAESYHPVRAEGVPEPSVLRDAAATATIEPHA